MRIRPSGPTSSTCSSRPEAPRATGTLSGSTWKTCSPRVHASRVVLRRRSRTRRPVGRVGFWTLPGMDEPFALVLLDVAWEEDHLDVGSRLLEDVLRGPARLGTGEIEHVIDDPPMRPQFQYHPERRIELLENAGFSVRRETRRFEWRGSSLPQTGRLSFRTLRRSARMTSSTR